MKCPGSRTVAGAFCILADILLYAWRGTCTYLLLVSGRTRNVIGERLRESSRLLCSTELNDMGNFSMQLNLLSATVVFAAILALLTFGVGQASAQSIEVGLPEIFEDEGDVIQIPILVEDVTGKNITSFYLKIEFDQAILKVNRSILTNTVSDVQGAAKFDVKNTPGEFTIAYAAPATRPLTGGGTLILVEAEVLASGSTDISFLTLEFNDGNVLSSTVDGYFSTIQTEPADTDEDGVPAETEANVPNLNGIGTGDGNGDGVQDSEQVSVTSLPDATSGDYVTVATTEGNALKDVSISATPPSDEVSPPSGVEFPGGFLRFKVEAGVGAATTVTMFSTREADTYYKFGPTPDNPEDHWYEFLYDGATGAEFLEDRVVLHFIDGERGDADLTANGTIDDPGALGITANQAPAASNVVSPDDGASVTVGGSAGGDPDDGDVTLFTIEWSDAADPDDDEVSYTIVLAGDAGFTSEIERYETSQATTLSVTVAQAADWFDSAHGSAELDASTTVYMRIAASDGSLETWGDIASLILVRGTVTSVEASEVPNAFALQGNYPNPFNPSTHISFDISDQARVSVDVFDSLGRRVLSVPDETFGAGYGRSIEINASTLPSGAYIYRVRAAMVQSTQVSTGIMTVMK